MATPHEELGSNQVNSIDPEDLKGSYIVTRDFKMMSGISLLSFTKGDVIDDPNTLRRIKVNHPDPAMPAPIRKVHPRDLV